MVPPAAVYKPPSKWTVVAALVFSVALHAGAVMWVETQRPEPPTDSAASSEQMLKWPVEQWQFMRLIG